MNIYRHIHIIIFLALFITNHSSCQNRRTDSLPKPVGFVNDFENIFTPAEEGHLDSMIVVYEARTSIQIALITVDTAMVRRKNFDNYILKIANAWGVGQKEKNNGITIGISKGYRAIRIQNGYGIEKNLSNSDTKAIIDSAFIPSFKKEQYFEGVVNGLKVIMNKLD